MDAIQGLMDFLAASPTAFHAVENIRGMLEAAGYATLNEFEPWNLAPGGRYLVTRNQSSIIAFRVPETGGDHFQIVSTHSDSPCFKLKPDAARAGQGYAMLNVEKYGGMIMSTWFDRPLSVTGRVIVRTDAGYETRLFDKSRVHTFDIMMDDWDAFLETHIFTIPLTCCFMGCSISLCEERTPLISKKVR